MAKVFVTGDSWSAVYLLYLLKGVQDVEGNHCGNPNNTRAFVVADDLTEWDDTYSIAPEITSAAELKTYVDANDRTYYLDSIRNASDEQYGAIYDWHADIKAEYPTATILVGINGNRGRYQEWVDYCSDNDITVHRVLSNTVVDVEDDGTINETEDQDDASLYKGHSVSWKVLYFFVL